MRDLNRYQLVNRSWRVLQRQCDILEKAKAYVISENYETKYKLNAPDALRNLTQTWITS
jgi:hypothetical protein